MPQAPPPQHLPTGSTSITGSRPLSDLHLVPSSAVDFHLPTISTACTANACPTQGCTFSQLLIQLQDQLHIPGFLHLLNPPDRPSCWKARRQNACLHCFPHLAPFLNSVEQLSARLRLTADRMSSLFSLSANCAQLRSNPGSDVALF